MINRRFAAWTLLVLFLGSRFVAPVVLASIKSDNSPAGFQGIPPLPDNAGAAFGQPFLDALHRAGFWVGTGQNDQGAINLAHRMCQELDYGQAVQQQERLGVVKAGLSEQDAHKFVVISIENYCPAHEKQISSSPTTAPPTAPPQLPS